MAAVRTDGAKSRSAKQFGGRPSLVVGGGLVVGIATVVVVGVAGKLLSKLRKPDGSTHNDTITPNGSRNEIVSGERPELLTHLEDGNLPPHAAVIHGKIVRSLDLCVHKEINTTSDIEVHTDPTLKDFHIETIPENVVDRIGSNDQLHSDFFTTQPIKEAKDQDDLCTASTVLSELVSHALLDAKNDSTSKQELLSKTKALKDGIAGVISRAFDDFSCGGMSSDEMTPTEMQVTVSWETNSSSSSEEDTHPQIHPDSEDLVADEAVLLPGSTTAKIGEQVMERINHDAPINQDEVPSASLRSSSAPLEKQEEELKGTIEENDPDSEPLQEEAGNSSADNKSNIPEVIVTEVEKENIEPERSDVLLKEDNKEAAKLLDEITTATPTSNRFRNDDEAVKKETTSQEMHANDEVETFRLTSIHLRNTEGSLPEVTAANSLDSVQISTLKAEITEGTPVIVPSLIVPATTHEISNTKIMAKESTVAAGIRRTAVVTTVELMSSTTGGLKQELNENWRGPNRSSLEVLGLALIVALIAVLFWLVRVRGNDSIARS